MLIYWQHRNHLDSLDRIIGSVAAAGAGAMSSNGKFPLEVAWENMQVRPVVGRQVFKSVLMIETNLTRKVQSVVNKILEETKQII